MSTEVVFYTYCTLRSRAAQQRTHTHTTHNKDHASWQPFLFSMDELSAVASRRATRAVCWKRHGDDSQHSHRHAEQEKQQETSTATQSQQQRRMYFLYSFLLLFLNWNVPIWLDGEGGKQQNQLNFSCSLFGGFKDLLIYLYISFFFSFRIYTLLDFVNEGRTLTPTHARSRDGFFGPLTDGTRVFFSCIPRDFQYAWSNLIILSLLSILLMIILVVFAAGLSVFDCDFRIWRSHIDVVGSYRSLSSLSALVMSHLFTSVNLGGFLFHRLFFSVLPPFLFYLRSL